MTAMSRQARVVIIKISCRTSNQKPAPGVISLMMKTFCLGITIAFTAHLVSAQDQIDISVKTGIVQEMQAKIQLQRILKSYDLSKWIFTKSVLIERGAVPHSHPVLTLNTRH